MRSKESVVYISSLWFCVLQFLLIFICLASLLFELEIAVSLLLVQILHIYQSFDEFLLLSSSREFFHRELKFHEDEVPLICFSFNTLA
jgi:hypothetical protein